ncbi:hypothetical protein CAPTEDRAFT_195777 [Capitella teleta]|uniref:Sulfotransferase domain-containing protein n=1 Tax=Capitella teleta TaxID=283909 RepID=R7TQ10_CAPTE|nr:hypothetical protein CAPTEDRAFT_195777 [Capitella teleta]|eukprot:ELT93125.1 hypothetical protein CAPTEDRAFT_195777 [Capitella teleta]
MADLATHPHCSGVSCNLTLPPAHPPKQSMNEDVVISRVEEDESDTFEELSKRREAFIDPPLNPVTYDDVTADTDEPIEISEEESNDVTPGTPEEEAEATREKEEDGDEEETCDEIMAARRRSLVDNLEVPSTEPSVVTKDYLKSENLDTEINEMRMEPIKYLANYKNPCWWENYNGTTSEVIDIRTEYAKVHWHKHNSYDPDTTHPLSADKTKRLRCAPLFYFIGVSKCATSDLLYYTNLHPMVQAPFIRNFIYWSVMRWVDTNRPDESIVPFKRYVEIFDAVSHEILRWTSPAKEEGGLPVHPLITGDASPTYAYFFEKWQRLPGNEGLEEPKYIIAHLIRETVPQARIVMNMRNPVDRYSCAF